MDKLDSAAGGESASEIVAYNNALIKLSDDQNQYIKSMNGNLDRIDKGLANYNDNFAFMALTPLFYNPTPGYNEPNPEQPGNAFEQADKEFFEKNVKILNENFQAIQTQYASLNEYIKAEDYKDDQGKSGKEMVKKVDDLVTKYYDTNSLVMDRIVLLSEKAEREVLKTHPFKDHIFAMKDASNTVEEFVSLAYDFPDDYKANEEKFKALYAKIEKYNQEREALDEPKNSAYPGKETYFSLYNKAANDFLVEARKIMRNAEAAGSFSDTDLDALGWAEENMRTTYNNFVD